MEYFTENVFIHSSFADYTDEILKNERETFKVAHEWAQITSATRVRYHSLVDTEESMGHAEENTRYDANERTGC